MRHPYISGPMTGLEHHNFPMFFWCETDLIRNGYDPLNPARTNQDETWETAYASLLETPETWESCIRRDIMDVLHCDSIVLLPNWQNSKGACLELVLSISIGNTVAVWFPAGHLVTINDPQPHYDMAIDCLKKFGTISPQSMYSPGEAVVY